MSTTKEDTATIAQAAIRTGKLAGSNQPTHASPTSDSDLGRVFRPFQPLEAKGIYVQNIFSLLRIYSLIHQDQGFFLFYQGQADCTSSCQVGLLNLVKIVVILITLQIQLKKERCSLLIITFSFFLRRDYNF
jgi:hypothetical protein